MELAGSAADTLLPLLLCEQELYQVPSLCWSDAYFLKHDFFFP